MPGRGAGEQPRVAHVAGAVTDEGDRQPGELVLVLADGQQVGQQLARVEVVGERVDHRDTGVLGHLLEVGLRVGAPHDRRGLATEDPGDVVRPTHGRRCRRAGRRPASGGRRARRCPAAKDDWVRRVCLSKIIATVRGPASGFASYGAVLELGREVEDLGLLGRGQVVVGQEVAGHASSVRGIAASRIAGQAESSALTSSSVTTSGGASRIRSGVGLLMMKPRCLGGRGDGGGDVGAQVETDQQPLAAHLGDPRVGGEAVAELLTEHGGVLEQVLGLDGPDHCEGGRAGHRVAAEGGAVVAGLEQVACGADGDAGADREAAAEALGDGDEVGSDVRRGGRTTHRCGPCRSAPRRATAARRARRRSRGPRRGSPRAARRRRPRPGSARAGWRRCPGSRRRRAHRRRRTARRRRRPATARTEPGRPPWR